MSFEPARSNGSHRDGGFVLYLEGPRDRDILRGWAYRLLPAAARGLFRSSVILGGRQPARALEHFERIGGVDAGMSALCVLDRDDGVPARLPDVGAADLEFFTWTRRHIESYLLVPDAIRRALRLSAADTHLERLLSEHLPAETEAGDYRDVDAKRILGPNGALSRSLGRRLALGDVARATREEELHADVLALFGRLRQRLGIATVTHVVREW